MLYTSYGTPVSYSTAASHFEVGCLASQYKHFPPQYSPSGGDDGYRPRTVYTPADGTNPETITYYYGGRAPDKPEPSIRRLLKGAIKNSYRQFVHDMRAKWGGAKATQSTELS
ncbi:hypothetical protein PC9H_010589 [Pleurotus ostreatus]|uniref:Uncharacterized protein n=2 Tax=Pleurotus TaxID=5320 RepID=A0A8H6ZP15_PLEOS|nr:uncharacterized protein PC9H_010589 [Pleurotus ostreatus]KAF7422433.1 hypothetical protein PC9H_010589 [Pleurotus ostreatus]KAG9227684.1 hypothetical protein CCMSSC00406_0000670 [Pleurotus cornucopiae]KAJ8691726.1 hypothetical protein PTI98_011265 [Pleurotus ostreatus]